MDSRIFLVTTFGVLLFAGSLFPSATAVEGIKRTQLQQLDVPDSGYKAVMGIAEIAVQSKSGRHFHPGIEVGYVLSGKAAMVFDDQPTLHLHAGDSYQVPTGVVHDVHNEGDEPMKLVTTYVVAKDKPLASPAPPVAK